MDGGPECGCVGRDYILTADIDDTTFQTVGDLKLAIQDRHGVRRFQQRLMPRNSRYTAVPRGRRI